LRKWTSQKNELKNAPPGIRQLNFSAHSKYPLLEADFKTWI
ncbi:3389_t:CDS:1, partial [Gigaspora margarita]